MQEEGHGMLHFVRLPAYGIVGLFWEVLCRQRVMVCCTLWGCQFGDTVLAEGHDLLHFVRMPALCLVQ